MTKLAIFDVDFTLTKKETLMQFYKYMVKRNFKNIIYLPRAIYSGLMFKLKVYDEKKTKETFLKFLKGFSIEEVDNLANDFYKEVIMDILYIDAIDMIKKCKDEGYTVVLISASPEFYISKFKNIEEVDLTFGTKFIFDNGRFICKIDGDNCKGEAKVNVLKRYFASYSIDVDWENSKMFSDSLSDKPLLDLVGEPYIINCKKKTKYTKLKWK